MIRAAVKADLKPLIAASTFANELLKQGPKATQKVMDGVKKKHGKRLLRPLHKLKPGRSKHGGRWSTDAAANTRAQKWFFAHFPKGYTRTGKLAKKFVIVTRVTRRRVSLAIENPDTKAKFVFSFAANPKRKGGRPNPGHVVTGWPKKGRKVTLKALEDARDKVEAAYRASAAATLAKGRFTVVVP